MLFSAFLVFIVNQLDAGFTFTFFFFPFLDSHGISGDRKAEKACYLCLVRGGKDLSD